MDVEDPGLAVYRTEVRRAVEDDWDGFRAHFETLAAERRFIAADLPVDWEAAVALYERFGFELEGRHRRHWRRSDGSLWDSVSMGLVLDETSPGSPY